MAIIERIPLSRSSERVKFDVGRDKYRCYSPSNPHYYMDSTSILQEIQLDYNENVNLATVGDVQLSNRNINSVGIRKDGNANKFLGIRPDKNQNLGTQQLEFSLLDISFDGTSQTINLNSCDKVDDFTTDLGDIAIRNNRNGVRQLIKAKNAKHDFKITYKLHLKNFEVENTKSVYSNETIRKKSTLISDNKGKLDTVQKNFEYNSFAVSYHNDSTAQNLIRTCFHDADIFILGSDCTHPELIPTDWNVWEPPDNSSIEKICTSVYLKNSFAIQIHKSTIYRKQLKSILCEFFSNLTGNQFEFSTEKVNNLDTPFLMDTTSSNDTKVVGLWTDLGDTFSLTVATEYFEDNNKLFAPGTQSYTGAIDISSYEDLIDSWNSVFVNNLYSDVLERGKDISIDGEYYEPDVNGNFIITDATNNIVYSIAKPKLIDDEFNIISEQTLHTLKDNGDGTYEYIKYPDAKCMVSDEIQNSSYIDADIYYGSTADGYIAGPGSATWDAEHDAATGGGAVSNVASYNLAVSTYNLKDATFIIYRSFFMFDTSAISGTVTACTMKIYGATRNAAYSAVGVSCQQGSQGTSLTTADYDAFSGNYFAYIASGSWSQSAYNSFVFNSAGLSGVSTTGTTQICCRDYDYDYLDSSPATDAQFAQGMFYADNTGTTKDPYLEVEVGGAYRQSPSQKTCIFG